MTYSNKLFLSILILCCPFLFFNCSKQSCDNTPSTTNNNIIYQVQIVPESRHLITSGTVNLINTKDNSQNISFTYKELNPKMDLDSSGNISQFYKDTLPILARNLLNNYPDMIYLDAEVAPSSLKLLLSLQVSDTNGNKYTLDDLYNVANDQFHGACLVKKTLFEIQEFNSQKDQFALGRDEDQGAAGLVLEKISRFVVTVKNTNKNIDIWLGKGPHYKDYKSSIKFFNDGTDYDDTNKKPISTGLLNALNIDHSNKTPVLMIGDWNNEINSNLLDNLNLPKYANILKDFKNLYSTLVDSPIHPGSNCKTQMDAIFAGGTNTGENINLTKLEHQGIVNTQVFYWANDSDYSANITSYGSNSGTPKILYSESLGFYGEYEIQDPIQPIQILSK